MEYSKKVIKYFQYPKNVGSIKNADAIGNMRSPVCGDSMKIYLKIKNDRIKKVKFRTFGCAASIASSSVLTEMIKGKTIKQARKITKKDIVKKLGGLPKTKIHCSILATDALKDALDKYKKVKRKKWQER